MQLLLLFLLVVHGAIHLMGFARAYGLAELPGLELDIGRGAGLLWLAAALLLLAAAVGRYAFPRLWWVPALVGILLSQALVFGAWGDARFGTVANAVLLVPVLLAAADQRPSSLRSRYRAEVARAAVSVPADAPPVTAAELEGLPAPVARYLERVGAVGRPRVRSFRATFDARIRGGADEPWMTGVGEQDSFVDPPARFFFMEATRSGLPVHVFHRYVGEEATMEVRLLGLFPVVELGGEAMTRAETVTLLNDLFFLAPPALLDAGIEWEELDDQRVRATFTNAGHTVSAIAYFDEAGDLVDFDSDDRSRMEDGALVPDRWSTPFYDHVERDGRRVASGGDARWGPAGEEWTYAEFRLRTIRYNDPVVSRPPGSAGGPGRR